MDQTKTFPGGRPTYLIDSTANDSDKTVTVPTGKIYELFSICADLVATATVGSRLLEVLIQDPDAKPIYRSLGVPVTASQNGSLNIWRSNGLSNTLLRKCITTGNAPNACVNDSMPLMFLMAGSTIRIRDSAAIDAAADDMTTVIGIREYDL